MPKVHKGFKVTTMIGSPPNRKFVSYMASPPMLQIYTTITWTSSDPETMGPLAVFIFLKYAQQFVESVGQLGVIFPCEYMLSKTKRL